MPDRFDCLFGQLLDGLQSAEKRHRTAYGSASDNSEWDVADRESAIALCITNWRRTLDTLRNEIMNSDALSDDDIGDITSLAHTEHVDESSQSADSPSEIDENRIGQYVWQKMRDLCTSGHAFSESELSNLQDSKWCEQILNLPYPFFIHTRNEIRYYWKRDTFVFNGVEFRLCMLWYNDLYRGRNQRECFDHWYDNLVTASADAPDSGIMNEETTVESALSGAQAIYESQQPETIIGTKPKKLQLLGKQYVVNDWNELYIKVCDILLLHRPYVLATLDKDMDFNSEHTNFSYIQSEIKYNRKRLANGLWVETNRNADDIKNTCYRLLEKCAFSPQELQIEAMEVHA